MKKILVACLIFLAGTAYGVVGVDSGLTSLYVLGNEIYVTDATSNDLKVFKFSPPSILSLVSMVAPTDQEPVFVSVPNPYVYVINRKSKTMQIFMADNDYLMPIGSVFTGFDPISAAVRLPYVFVANSGSNTLEVFDTSCNSRPLIAGQIKTESITTSVCLDGKYAYVTCFGANKLQIFNVARIRWGISLTGAIATDEGPVAAFVSSPNAYVINAIANTLQIFNVSNPSAPAESGWVRTENGPTSVYADGNLVYVTNRLANSLEIFDVSNSARPILIHRLPTDFGPTTVVVKPPYAYVASHRSLQVFDVSDPLRGQPFLVASSSVR